MTERSRELGRSAGPEEQNQVTERRQLLQGVISGVWQARDGLYRDLIDRVSGDQYPSPAMLDMIERGIPPELYLDYVSVLADKVNEAKYPSPALLARLQRLTAVPDPHSSAV